MLTALNMNTAAESSCCWAGWPAWTAQSWSELDDHGPAGAHVAQDTCARNVLLPAVRTSTLTGAHLSLGRLASMDCTIMVLPTPTLPTINVCVKLRTSVEPTNELRTVSTVGTCAHAHAEVRTIRQKQGIMWGRDTLTQGAVWSVARFMLEV